MDGREVSTELEVVEYVKDERVRIVSDTHGTVWDTVFSVTNNDQGQTVVALEMDVKPHQLLARLTTPFIRGMLTKALEADMDSVKTYCEQQVRLAHRPHRRSVLVTTLWHDDHHVGRRRAATHDPRSAGTHRRLRQPRRLRRRIGGVDREKCRPRLFRIKHISRLMVML